MNDYEQYEFILNFCKKPIKRNINLLYINYNVLYWLKCEIKEINKLFEKQKLNKKEKVRFEKNKKLLNILNEQMLYKNIQNLPKDIKKYILDEFIETPVEYITNYGERCKNTFIFKRTHLDKTVYYKDCTTYAIQHFDIWIIPLINGIPYTFIYNNLKYNILFLQFIVNNLKFSILKHTNRQTWMYNNIGKINKKQIKNMINPLKDQNELNGYIYINMKIDNNQNNNYNIHSFDSFCKNNVIFKNNNIEILQYNNINNMTVKFNFNFHIK